MDEPSLSEHEQRILEEIERNLAAEDPDFVRQVREVGPSRNAVRILRFGILGLVAGLGLLLGYTYHVALGLVGFLVMLGGAVAIGTSVRQLTQSGRPPGASMRAALRRAQDRFPRRRPDDEG